MIRETGSETKELPHVIDEFSKIKVVIENQKAEIKDLNEKFGNGKIGNQKERTVQ